MKFEKELIFSIQVEKIKSFLYNIQKAERIFHAATNDKIRSQQRDTKDA